MLLQQTLESIQDEITSKNKDTETQQTTQWFHADLTDFAQQIGRFDNEADKSEKDFFVDEVDRKKVIKNLDTWLTIDDFDDTEIIQAFELSNMLATKVNEISGQCDRWRSQAHQVFAWLEKPSDEQIATFEKIKTKITTIKETVKFVNQIRMRMDEVLYTSEKRVKKNEKTIDGKIGEETIVETIHLSDETKSLDICDEAKYALERIENEEVKKRVRDFCESKSESTLDLAYTWLTNLDLKYALIVLKKAGKMTNLQRVDLSWPNLTSLPPEIWQLTNLQSISLKSPNLTSLPPEIWQLTNLQELNLYRTNLTSLPPEIWQLTNLQELDLYRTNLTSLPPEIWQLTNLQRLDLKWTNLTSLPPKLAFHKVFFDEAVRNEYNFGKEITTDSDNRETYRESISDPKTKTIYAMTMYLTDPSIEKWFKEKLTTYYIYDDGMNYLSDSDKNKLVKYAMQNVKDINYDLLNFIKKNNLHKWVDKTRYRSTVFDQQQWYEQILDNPFHEIEAIHYLTKNSITIGKKQISWLDFIKNTNLFVWFLKTIKNNPAAVQYNAKADLGTQDAYFKAQLDHYQTQLNAFLKKWNQALYTKETSNGKEIMVPNKDNNVVFSIFAPDDNGALRKENRERSDLVHKHIANKDNIHNYNASDTKSKQPKKYTDQEINSLKNTNNITIKKWLASLDPQNLSIPDRITLDIILAIEKNPNQQYIIKMAGHGEKDGSLKYWENIFSRSHFDLLRNLWPNVHLNITSCYSGYKQEKWQDSYAQRIFGDNSNLGSLIFDSQFDTSLWGNSTANSQYHFFDQLLPDEHGNQKTEADFDGDNVVTYHEAVLYNSIHYNYSGTPLYFGKDLKDGWGMQGVMGNNNTTPNETVGSTC